MESLKAFKIGDNFDITYSLPIEFGSSLSSIQSDIRNQNYGLVEHLTVLQLPDTETESVWQITATNEQTALWPTGQFICDIKHIAVDGNEIHSDTFLVPVIKQVTI